MLLCESKSIFPVCRLAGIVVAKNYERKMLPASFNYVVLAVGQDPGRTEVNPDCILNYLQNHYQKNNNMHWKR